MSAERSTFPPQPNLMVMSVSYDFPEPPTPVGQYK